MGKTAFFLRAYNDIDHIAPVIWKFVKAGDNPVVVFHTDIDYENDYRIKFLMSEGEVQIFRFLDKEYVNYEKANRALYLRFLKRIYDQKRSTTTLIGRIYRRLLFDCSEQITFFKNYDISKCVFEWNSPYFRGEMIEKFFKVAKGLGITTFCLPHGCNMFVHSDVAKSHREMIKRGIVPDPSARNEYDYYIIQNPIRRDGFVKWGMNPIKTFAWGSARWCPEWQKINLEICPSFSPKSKCDDLLKVVFMQYQADYNLEINEIWDTLSTIAECDWVYLVIKDSTRAGTQYYSNEFATRHGHSERIELVGDEAHSPSLIKWSDCVVSFGSSIGMEVLMQNKPLINPTYLIKNRTLYERTGSSLTAENKDQVLSHLKKVFHDRSFSLPEISKKALLREIVYGGLEEHDVLESYYRKIKTENLMY